MKRLLTKLLYQLKIKCLATDILLVSMFHAVLFECYLSAVIFNTNLNYIAIQHSKRRNEAYACFYVAGYYNGPIIFNWLFMTL